MERGREVPPGTRAGLGVAADPSSAGWAGPVVDVTEVRVRYAETDQMGRVHHRHHLVWCELGRTALMRRHGVSYTDLERDGVWLPVSGVEVRYGTPAGYDDKIRIHTWVEGVRSRQLTFAYRITSHDDATTHARARTVLVCTDADGAPRRIPPAVRERLLALAGRGGTKSGAADGRAGPDGTRP